MSIRVVNHRVFPGNLFYGRKWEDFPRISEDLMTASEVVQYLKVNLDTVYRLIRTGRRHEEVACGEAM